MKKESILWITIFIIIMSSSVLAEYFAPVTTNVGVNIISTNSSCVQINTQEYCNTLNITEGIVFDNESNCGMLGFITNCSIEPGSVKVSIGNISNSYGLNNNLDTIISDLQMIQVNETISTDAASMQSLFHSELVEQDRRGQTMFTDFFQNYKTTCDKYVEWQTKSSACDTSLNASETKWLYCDSSLKEKTNTINILMVLFAIVVVAVLIFMFGSGNFTQRIKNKWWSK